MSGTGAGQTGKLEVGGTASLDGTLRIDTSVGFAPSAGQSLDIVSAATRTGTFATVTGTAGGGLGYRPLYMPPGVQLVVAPEAEFTISAATPNPVVEGNSGTSPATFTVSQATSTADTPQAVSYATQYGTATPGSDYVYQEQTLTFAPGETTKRITVAVKGDLTPEPDETFFVQLYNPTGGATLGPASGGR